MLRLCLSHLVQRHALLLGALNGGELLQRPSLLTCRKYNSSRLILDSDAFDTFLSPVPIHQCEEGLESGSFGRGEFEHALKHLHKRTAVQSPKVIDELLEVTFDEPDTVVVVAIIDWLQKGGLEQSHACAEHSFSL